MADGLLYRQATPILILTWALTQCHQLIKKVDVSKLTVVRVMRDAGLEPSPDRIKGKSWKDFILEHFATLSIH